MPHKQQAGERIATEALWVCDFRTNKHFTLRERQLKRADLDDFIAAFGSWRRRQDRTESERFRRFSYAELAKRDKLNLDITWLKDASATDPDSLPPPAVVAAEIVEGLELALEKFRAVAAIRTRMEEAGYTQADLARLLGSRSRASEILGPPPQADH